MKRLLSSLFTLFLALTFVGPVTFATTTSSTGSGSSIECPDPKAPIDLLKGFRGPFFKRLQERAPDLYETLSAKITELIREHTVRLKELCESNPERFEKLMERRRLIIKEREKRLGIHSDEDQDDDNDNSEDDSQEDNDGKVTICHKTLLTGGITLRVSEKAWEAHEMHGDYKGACGSPRDDDSDDDEEDLEVEVEVSDDSVDAGDTFYYDITVKNNTSTKKEVNLSAELADQTEFVSANSSGEEDDGTVSWDDLEVDGDDETEVRLTVKIDTGADDGDILKLKASIPGDSAEAKVTVGEESNNNDSDLSVSIADAPDPAEAGEKVKYTITVTNDTNSDEEPDLCAELDTDMEFVDASGNGEEDGDEVCWNNLEVAEGDSENVTLEVRIDSGADDGDTVKLTASIPGDEDQETTTIGDGNGGVTEDDIDLTVTDSPDPVEPDETVEYTIKVENNADEDTEFTLCADIDSDTEFVDASGDGEEDNDEVCWNDVELDAGDEETFEVTVRANDDLEDGDEIQLKATVDGDDYTVYYTQKTEIEE